MCPIIHCLYWHLSTLTILHHTKLYLFYNHIQYMASFHITSLHVTFHTTVFIFYLIVMSIDHYLLCVGFKSLTCYIHNHYFNCHINFLLALMRFLLILHMTHLFNWFDLFYFFIHMDILYFVTITFHLIISLFIQLLLS